MIVSEAPGLDPGLGPRFGPLERLCDHQLGLVYIAPAVDFDPFIGLQIFVMGEKMFDLGGCYVGQISDRGDVIIALGEFGGWHCNDFFISPSIIFHDQNPNRATVDDRTGDQRSRVANQNIYWVAIG